MGWISRIGLRIAYGSVATSPSWAAVIPPAIEPSPAPSILLAYATQTGSAEHYARDTAVRLRRAGVEVQLIEFDALSTQLLASVSRVLLVVSTTYDGEAPDTADAFSVECMHEPAALGSLEYGLLSLGDRCYRDFCAFGRRLHAWLQASGAQAAFDPVEVDDEEAAALAQWHQHVSTWIREVSGGMARGNG